MHVWICQSMNHYVLCTQDYHLQIILHFNAHLEIVKGHIIDILTVWNGRKQYILQNFPCKIKNNSRFVILHDTLLQKPGSGASGSIGCIKADL